MKPYKRAFNSDDILAWLNVNGFFIEEEEAHGCFRLPA